MTYPEPPPSDSQRDMARMKSYTGSAVLVLILYLVFWLPGFIVNIIFMNEAKKMEKVAGQGLPGTGCLVFLFWFNIVGIIIGFILWLAAFGGLAILGLTSGN